MRTMCSAEKIEDELNELKLRIAKTNARRNAQINLLQRNIADGSTGSKIYSKHNDLLKSRYLGYPLHYYWPYLHPYKYSSWNDVLDAQYMDDLAKKSPTFLSKRDHSDAYKLLEQKVQSDVLRKLKRFVLDQEKDITDEFLDKLILQRNPYSAKLRLENKLDNKTQADIGSKLNPDDSKSPFLKPINKSDNFYKRYNSFMKRILKPLRKISPPSKNDSNILTQNTNWKYKQPLTGTSKYFPPKITKPTTPIKTPLNDLDVSYLRPWQKYVPIHRDYFADYEQPPKNYRIPRDVETIIRDMEFENRRTYPFMSAYPYNRSNYNYYSSNPMKYDPYESDSYVRSTLPTWKQYYYTQKLRSKPSHERFVDYYDPYRDFFYDGASAKSDDMNLSPNRDDSEVNSMISENCSVLPLSKSYESMNDLQIIDDYRDSIYNEIINNLRNQQKRKFKKNKRFSSRSFTPGLLRNDRSLYNYRITEPNLSRSYSWRQPNTYDSTYDRYNFKNSSVLLTDDKWKSPKYDNVSTPTMENKFIPSKYNLPLSTENKFTPSKYNLPLSTENKLNARESTENQDTEINPSKYTSNVSSSGNNQLNMSPSREFPSTQKYTDDVFPTASDEKKYQMDSNSSPKYSTQSYKFTPLDLEKSNTSSNDITSFPASSNYTKVQSPAKENINSCVFEKDPESVNPVRKASTFENRQFSGSSPTRQTVTSPKRQSLQSNPPSPVSHLPEASSTIPPSLSRKNSIQFPARKGSVQTSSIEEEPNTFARIDKNRRYSKDQSSYPTEMTSNNTIPGPTLDKRLSYGGGIKEPINEVKEEKITPEAAYDSYSQYKELENIPQKKDYLEELNRSHKYQPQNFETTATIPSGPDTSNDPNYQETHYYETPQHSSSYSRYPDQTNAPNYNEKYYNSQYDSNTGNAYKPYNEYPYPDHKNEYNDQYNYPAGYDENTTFDGKPSAMDSSYVEPRGQYKDPNYTMEKRPSNESYHAADLPRATEYEKYQDEDYKPSDYYRNNVIRNADNRGSINQGDNYGGNKYQNVSQDENYNSGDFRYQDHRPYRDDYRTGPPEGHSIGDSKYMETEPKSFENYSPNSNAERNPNDQSYPYSEQNSYENTNYPSGESYNELVPDKISETPVENVKPVSSEVNVKERKKSLAIESSQESEVAAAEPPPKEVPSISRRTSKAALTLAEQRKAASLAEKNKTAKAKLNESKLKRMPSVLNKTKPVAKKT